MSSPGGRIEIEVVPDVRQFPNKLQAGLKPATGIASAFGKGLGAAIAGGTIVAAVGLKEVLKLGVEYQNQLNTLQSVTQATGAQMAQVGNLAKELGSDLSLPATSAADAAAAMTELAKGGLTVEQAMTAAKGTLQLAAAAQIDAARAAEIQSDALNQFGLAAGEAGRVADILANTANAASGEVVDIANALKFVGPVAKTVNEPIENVATAIGLIATQGIRGEQAGTSLRGMIASLSAPSGPASKALETLGIKAFDASGKFIGLRAVTEQLAAAKGRLTDAAFTEAAAVAFGNEGMTTASALASTGAKAFDDMASSVTRAGGAADVAAAKTKGLGGAWEGLKSQLETTGIGIFEAIDGPLEKAVRGAAEHIDGWSDEVIGGIENAVAAGELFGPALAKSLSARASVVGDAVDDIVDPIANGALDVLNELANTGITAFDDLTGVLDKVVDAAKPVAEGVRDLAEASSDGDGAVSAFGAGVGLAGDALKAAAAVIGPVGSLIGGLVEGFSELPGPVQSAVIALVAYKVAQRALGDTTALTGIRQFAGEMRVQQGLAASSGQEIGKLSAAMAAYRTSTVPAVAAARGFTDQTAAIRAGAAAAGEPIGRMSAALGTLTERSSTLSSMRTAFDNASSGAERFGTAAGLAAAGGTGLRAAASGLIGAMGGPFGVAIAGAAVGLSYLASKQQDAAKKSQEHESRVATLADALRESNGVITTSIRLTQAKALQSEKLADSETSVADAARAVGISLDSVTDATLGNGKALDELRSKLEEIIRVNTVVSDGDLMGGAGTATTLNEQGQAAQGLLNKINELAGGFQDAERQRKELDTAIKNGTASMLDATASGRGLAAAVKTLGDNSADADSKARRLKDAIDALTGGQISLERAQFAVKESLVRIGDLFAANGTDAEKAAAKTKGYGDALINADGSMSDATENGRRLRAELESLAANSIDVANRAYEMARAQGDDVPAALEKARQAMVGSQAGLVALAKEAGLSADQLRVLGERAGLLPDDVRMVIKAVDADKTTLELIEIKARIDRVDRNVPITVKTLSEEAQRKLEEVGFKVVRTPNNVTITANSDSAYSTLNNFLNAPATKTVTVRVNTIGAPISYAGQYGAVQNAAGNIVATGAVKAFRSGGFHKALKPMRAGLAAIVPPNTWRVIGDRLRDDEAYIPINRSSRSVALLDETAERMGYALMRRYANGGIANAAAYQAPPVPMSSGGKFEGQLYLDSGELLGTVRGAIRQELNAEAREVRYRGGRA